MATLREIASFARWRLVPVRYATRLMHLKPASFARRSPSRLPTSHAVTVDGVAAAPAIDVSTLSDLQASYRPRIAAVTRQASGHPFKNLFEDEDITSSSPLLRWAFSAEVLDVALDYFGGACLLDSMQVLYSWPTDDFLRESQKWHLDYADTKSLHYIAYLDNVECEADGPFVFVDRQASREVGRSMVIRRIADEQFREKVGDDRLTRFYGKAGEALWVDPAACYHYGSRCRNASGRLAVFITFSSTMPFVRPQAAVLRNRRKLLEIGRLLRPDLNDATLRRLLMMS